MSAPTTRPLTKVQLEYATQRLGVAMEARLTKACEKLIKPVPIPSMENTEMYAHIISGKAKVKSFEQLNNYMSGFNAFTYPEHDKKIAVYQKAKMKYEADCEKAVAPIKAAHRMAMDALVMGNAAEALQIVEDFASGKY